MMTIRKSEKLISRAAFAGALTLVTALLTGCGQPESESTTTESTFQAAPAEVGPVSVVIEGNDQMRYNITKFEVYAGQEVTITFNNVGKMKKDVMGHNVVVLKRGADGLSFAMQAMTARENDYLPEDDASILATTRLLGPGETDTITFTAPDSPGSHEYVCTFPGHYQAGMRGEMVVLAVE